MKIILILICAQLLFTIGDLMGRAYMKKYGFSLDAFITIWFFIYMTIRTIATFLQLYVFASMPLGKTMALFGAASIILSNFLSFFLLKENLSLGNYLGISLAVTAFIIMAFSE